MTDEGTKVTFRMGPEEIQLMEDFMDDRDIGNRSDFIRDAIRGYIESERSDGRPGADSDGLFVRLSEVHMDTLERLKEGGICYDIEEFARKCILDVIVPAEVSQDTIGNAFRAAQIAYKM